MAPIPAHEVRDLRALVRRALDDELKHRNAHLDPTAYDDALAYLVAEAWQLSTRYDPARSRPNPAGGPHSNFSSWCYQIIRRRYTDWLRWSDHDARYGPDREPDLSLDYLLVPYRDGHPDEPHPGAAYTWGTRLVETLASSTGDPATDRSPDLQRVLDQGSSRDTRLLDQPRPRPAPRAGRRDT
jgi:DNA-directed RNA polymerase specialized sigma24 family protein